MSASINDKITDTFNSANPNVARVTGTRAALGATLSCDNLAGWPTGSAVHFSTYQINTSNTVVAGTQIDWKGIVSGNNIGSLTRQAGATDAGNTIGDVVEMNPTGSWGHDLFTGFTAQHSQLDGSHGVVTATSVASTGQVSGSNLKLTTGTIFDTNGNEEIKTVATSSAVNEVTVTNAATGTNPRIAASGDDSNVLLDLRGKGTSGVGLELRVQNDNSNSITNATTAGIKFQAGWGQVLGNSTAVMTDPVTFPTAFTTVMGVICTPLSAKSTTAATDITGLNAGSLAVTESISAVSITNSGFSADMERSTGTFANTFFYGYSWLAWGV